MPTWERRDSRYGWPSGRTEKLQLRRGEAKRLRESEGLAASLGLSLPLGRFKNNPVFYEKEALTRSAALYVAGDVGVSSSQVVHFPDAPGDVCLSACRRRGRAFTADDPHPLFRRCFIRAAVEGNAHFSAFAEFPIQCAARTLSEMRNRLNVKRAFVVALKSKSIVHWMHDRGI